MIIVYYPLRASALAAGVDDGLLIIKESLVYLTI